MGMEGKGQFLVGRVGTGQISDQHYVAHEVVHGLRVGYLAGRIAVVAWLVMETAQGVVSHSKDLEESQINTLQKCSRWEFLSPARRPNLTR